MDNAFILDNIILLIAVLGQLTKKKNHVVCKVTYMKESDVFMCI